MRGQMIQEELPQEDRRHLDEGPVPNINPHHTRRFLPSRRGSNKTKSVSRFHQEAPQEVPEEALEMADDARTSVPFVWSPICLDKSSFFLASRNAIMASSGVEWLKRDDRCPLCRKDLMAEVPAQDDEDDEIQE